MISILAAARPKLRNKKCEHWGNAGLTFSYENF